jgi:hypothetical protein
MLDVCKERRVVYEIPTKISHRECIRDGGMVQVVEHLPTKWQTPSSNPNTAKKIRRKKKKLSPSFISHLLKSRTIFLITQLFVVCENVNVCALEVGGCHDRLFSCCPCSHLGWGTVPQRLYSVTFSSGVSQWQLRTTLTLCFLGSKHQQFPNCFPCGIPRCWGSQSWLSPEQT